MDNGCMNFMCSIRQKVIVYDVIWLRSRKLQVGKALTWII